MNSKQIVNLLNQLQNSSEYETKPATLAEIAIFTKNSIARKIPENVIKELTELYSIANEYYYEIVIGFHNCTDEIIYEWWEDDGELWLGQRDFYTIRWTKGKFCLGDASNTSFGEEYETENLIGLIEICINEINQANYFEEK